MSTMEFVCQSEMPVSAAELFRYHAQPGAFQRLMPPWERLIITQQPPSLSQGSRLGFLIKKGPIKFPWLADHPELVPGKMFTDVQLKGPFRSWIHHHRFEALSESTSTLIDELQIELPGGWFGRLTGAPFLRRQLQRMFRFRHSRTLRDIGRQKQKCQKLRIILVGGQPDWVIQLAAFLSTGGHTVYAMSRSSTHKLSMHPFFDPGNPCHPLDECDAVILTGIPLFRHPVDGVFYPELVFLNRALATLAHKPQRMIQIFPPGQQLPEWQVDPQLPQGRQHDRDSRKTVFENQLDQLEKWIPNVCRLHLGALLLPKPADLVQLLLQLESFVFLGQQASTAHFHWISQDDLIGCIWHLLNRPEVQGDLACIHPQSATRAELQQVLISNFFSRYALSRIFQIVGWHAPGHSPAIHEHLAAMPGLNRVGFIPQTKSLKDALFAEFGLFNH